MMDKKPRKELIDGLRDSLRNYEEPYDGREWELFLRRRKTARVNPIRRILKLIGIAACMFVVVYASVKVIPLIPLFDTEYHQEGETKQYNEPHLQDGMPETEDTDTMDSSRTISREFSPRTENELSRSHPTSPNAGRLEETEPILTANAGFNIRQEYFHPPISLREIPGGPHWQSFHDPISAPWIPNKRQGLDRETIRDDRPSTLHQRGVGGPTKLAGSGFPTIRQLVGNRASLDDLRIGIHIDPAIAKNGFSLGGGLSAQIPLSSRISTEIGTDFSLMKTGINYDIVAPSEETSISVGKRHTIGILAIPVSLNYTFTEQVSASVGIVPFGAVSERRTDVIRSYRWITDGTGSSGDPNRRLVGKRETIASADSLYRGQVYWGFIQLSSQISPPVLKRHNTAIAPFVRFPVGRLREGDYDWLHGGVSLRFYLR